MEQCTHEPPIYVTPTEQHPAVAELDGNAH